jgi:PAS domain S-box-containing protein
MDIGERYAWLQMLIETSFAARFLIGDDGRIIYSNSAAQGLLGYSAEQLAGKPIGVIFSTEEDQALAMPRLDRLAGMMMRGDDQEIKGRAKDGAELTLRVGTNPIRTLAGTFLSVTVFDVTKYKQNEAELRFRARQLEEANKLVSRFAYLVSHDLQEPLRKMASFATLMKTALAEGDVKTAAHACDVIHSTGSRARSLVASLLDYCLGASAILNLEHINVRDEIEKVLQDLSESLNRTGATVQNDIPDDLRVKADRSQFARLMNNLIENSISFHKSGEQPEIVVSAFADHAPRRVQLSVVDRGIGLEPQDADAIFDPLASLKFFSRVPADGIAFAVAKSICERHGWSVKAESSPGEGATFRVSIPTDQFANNTAH